MSFSYFFDLRRNEQDSNHFNGILFCQNHVIIDVNMYGFTISFQAIDHAYSNMLGLCTKDSIFVIDIADIESKGSTSESCFSKFLVYRLSSEERRSFSHLCFSSGLLVAAGKSSCARKRKVKIFPNLQT